MASLFQNRHSIRSLKGKPIAGIPSIPASTAALIVPNYIDGRVRSMINARHAQIRLSLDFIYR
jgi:hypothetical protein